MIAVLVRLCTAALFRCYSLEFCDASEVGVIFFQGATKMKLSRILGVVCVLFCLILPAWSTDAPTVTIFVDASSAPRKIFHAKLKIPTNGAELTLYYPKWIPGEHAPDGPVIDLGGLKFFE